MRQSPFTFNGFALALAAFNALDLIDPVAAVSDLASSFSGGSSGSGVSSDPSEPDPGEPPAVPEDEIQPMLSPKYSAGGTHNGRKEELEDEKAEKKLGARTHKALQAIEKEEKTLAKDLHKLTHYTHENVKRQAKFEKRDREFRHRLPRAIRSALGTIVGRYINPAVDMIDKMVEKDPLLSNSTRQRIHTKLAGDNFTDLKDGLGDWITARSSIGERVVAGGYPLIAGGLLAYLNNSPGGLNSPDVRIGWALSLLGAAAWGSSASAWTAAALVPVVEYFGSFINAPQGAIWSSLAAGLVHTGKVLSVTVSAIPKAFTPSNATAAFLPGIYYEETVATGVIVLIGMTSIAGTIPLTGAATTVAGTVTGASTASVATDVFQVVQPVSIGAGTNIGRDTLVFSGVVS